MSLMLLALIAWLGLMPLGFWLALVLLPPHLHRRAIAKLGPQLAEVVDLRSVRERRALVTAERRRAL
jgi:hypothetical protein